MNKLYNNMKNIKKIRSIFIITLGVIIAILLIRYNLLYN